MSDSIDSDSIDSDAELAGQASDQTSRRNSPGSDPPQARRNHGQGLRTISFGPHFELQPVVFPLAAVVIALLVMMPLLWPRDQLLAGSTQLRDWVGNQFGWLYVAVMNGWLLFVAYLAFGPYGKVRLGRDDQEPDFGRLSWFAMLFSAGMGIGLVFWSVAEPISHFVDPPPEHREGDIAARIAMATTIFHWGLHPWALYTVVGMALAYFGFRKKMPLSFRSLLHPILGDRVWGPTGHVIDAMAIVATLIGVATSLGIGAQQVNAGLAFLFGLSMSTTTEVMLIALITMVATVSVVLGLGKGIRRLSELNIALAAALMMIVILTVGLSTYFRGLIENVGAYLQWLPSRSFHAGGFSPVGRTWLNNWTVFYWAWWISWSPFVGMFIARVSRGRTIREFIVGVMLMPTAIGIMWLTAFGNTTIRQHTDYQRRGPNDSVELPQYEVATVDADGVVQRESDGTFTATSENLTAVEYFQATVVTADHQEQIAPLPTVLFAMLDGLLLGSPLVGVTAGIATLCIVLFFVTSSDSASMVIDMMASGGNPNPPVGTRLFWAISEGLVAAMLLIAGGLRALQAASIAAALPMTVILILASLGLLKALRQEEALRQQETVRQQEPV